MVLAEHPDAEFCVRARGTNDVDGEPGVVIGNDFVDLVVEEDTDCYSAMLDTETKR